MQNLKYIIEHAIQLSGAWICLVVGHLASDVTLQNVALVASIVYSFVNVYVLWRDKLRHKNRRG